MGNVKDRKFLKQQRVSDERALDVSPNLNSAKRTMGYSEIIILKSFKRWLLVGEWPIWPQWMSLFNVAINKFSIAFNLLFLLSIVSFRSALVNISQSACLSKTSHSSLHTARPIKSTVRFRFLRFLCDRHRAAFSNGRGLAATLR